MRRIITLSCLAFIAVVAFAAQKRIMVNTAEEFIKALGSNREVVVCNEDGLLLTPAIERMARNKELKMFDYSTDGLQTGIMYDQDTDGIGLYISGIKNLTITSNVKGDRRSIEVTPRYVNVLTFVNCENIKLTDLLLGHTKDGYCSNGVVGFSKCKDISIDNCGLFGCGTEGVELRESSHFTMTDSEIFRCSYYIMHIIGSSDVNFTNCVFYENREFEQVTVTSSCTDVVFDHCVFTDNKGTLFNLHDQSNVKLRRCVISHGDNISNSPIECDEDCIWVTRR